MTESMFFILYHMAQVLALGFNWGECGNLYYKRKTLLVVGGTRTRVLADRMTIAASVLHTYNYNCQFLDISLASRVSLLKLV